MIASLLAFFWVTVPASALFAVDGTIKIAISTSMSGSFANVGVSTKNGAELAKQEVDALGGISIGGKTYSLELLYGDNSSNRSNATTLILSRIGQDQVLAVIGPQSSDRAIAVGEVANAFKTPMITPWSTSPLTTLNRPYVFRMPVLYDLQGVAMSRFATREWGATRVAVLYDEVSPYPTGMARAFRKSFEEIHGPGSVVAFETFRTGATDFSSQLQVIFDSGADFLYTPQHYEEVPVIVKQAKAMGWRKPIAGSNSWSGGDLVGRCGDQCNGLFFTGNFASGGTDGIARTFVDQYEKVYNKLPDEVAALTYDALRLIIESLKNTGGLSGNIVADRTLLKDQLAATRSFEGVTGTMGFNDNGDPNKCAVIIKIDDNGLFTTYETICP